MKKILLFQLVFVCILLRANTQTFFKSYDVSSASSGSIISANDGGYIRVASIYYERRTHLLFLKTNASGDVQWSKTWGPVDGTQVSNIIQTTDGGYAVAASTSDGTKTGMILLKLNAAGNTEWVKHYTANNDMRGVESLVQTPDGGYAFAGEKIQQVLLSERKRACLVKTDGAGNILWSKLIFKLNTYSSIDEMAITKDGGFILVGGFSPSDENTPGSYLIKLKANGTQEWIRTTAGSNFHQFTFVKVLSDGGYLLGGSVSVKNMRSDMFITKVNAAGVSLWSKLITSQAKNSIDQTDAFYDAVELPDSYLAVGYTDSSGDYNPALARFGKNGKLMASVILNTPNKTYAYAVSSYTNKGFAVALHEYANAAKTYTAKFDKLGRFCNTLTNFGVGRDTSLIFQDATVPFDNFSNLQVTSSSEQTISLQLNVTDLCNNTIVAENAGIEQNSSAVNFEDAGIYLSPNPVVNTLILQWKGRLNENASIEIYSVAGKKMYEKILNGSKIDNRLNIPVNSFTKGIYLLKLKSGASIKTIKFMKE